MPDILIMNMDRMIHCKNGSSLLQALVQEHIYVESPCGGNGTCGKCRIRHMAGTLPLSTIQERKLLTEDERMAGYRLACEVYPQDFAAILVPQESNGKKEEQPEWMRYEYKLSEEQKKNASFAAAVDLGTTTIAASLIDTKNSRTLDTETMVNPQTAFGQDILTRITYEQKNKEKGIEELQKAAAGAIDELIGRLCSKCGVGREEIKEIVVAANTTMMHMLLGVDAESLGKAPYKPVFTGSRRVSAKELGIHAAAEKGVYCLPGASAFIGADVVAGAQACDMCKEFMDRVLLLDIGTNGEFILAKDGELLSCSCAAGPALEGMNISSGMRAAEGAIELVEIYPEGIRHKVIGGGRPYGLCGSGILSAVNEMLRTGIIKEDGSFIKKEELPDTDWRRRYLIVEGKKRSMKISEGDRPILITQGDIRQIQLAKGALLSGFWTLLEEAGLKAEELYKVLIAGQFGAHIRPQDLTGIGIVPKEVEDKIRYVGNAALGGTYQALVFRGVKEELESLAGKISYIELGETKGYQERFINCLQFAQK